MCDTFVIRSPLTADRSTIFGKNSDREPNEAQVLEFVPPGSWPGGSMVRCTYRRIPQVRETLGVLLCRPFWMWGAEMGANENGVVIGNEAVWTRMPLDRSGGLTGMDLLRLTLERAGSADEAVETLARLLADYGQGGICGFTDRRMAYHNGFIIADPHDAWVVETAGSLWAALKIKDRYAISNALTIGEAFDRSHPELVSTARKRGWLKSGETFHFARCYSDWMYTTFSAAKTRRARAGDLTNGKSGKICVSDAMQMLRDHGGPGYRPERHLLGNRLCAHAANPITRNATQTTGSMIAHLAANSHAFWATGTAAPCTGLFKPVWIEGNVLPDIGPVPDGEFNPDALWWQHEMLHRSVMLDYQHRLDAFSAERDQMEGAWVGKAAGAGNGKRWALTQRAFEQSRNATKRWTERVRAIPVRQRPDWLYRRYWYQINRKIGLVVR